MRSASQSRVRPPSAHGFDAFRPDDALDFRAARHLQLAWRPGGAGIDDLDLRARLGQGLRDRIGAVVVGRDRHALADQHGMAAQIDERRVGGHHAGPVIVRHDERALDRARRDHDPLRPDAPERVGGWRATLPGADEIGVIDAIGRRPGHDASVRGFDRARDGARPIPPVSAPDFAATMDELAADFAMIVEEKHDPSRASRGVSRGEAGRPRADDENVAARMKLRIVGLRAIVRIDAAEPGHGADGGFEGPPAGP